MKGNILSPCPPPKISLKHDLNWNKGQDQGSTVEHRPVGKLVSTVTWRNRSIGSSKPTQSPKTNEDRSGETRSSRDCYCVARKN